MPSSNMADIDDDDEWSSFDSTPTESFSRISFKSDSYETLGPPQTCDAGLEGDRGTPAEEIARCFPLLPAAPAKDDTYFAFSFNDSRYLRGKHHQPIEIQCFHCDFILFTGFQLLRC